MNFIHFKPQNQQSYPTLHPNPAMFNSPARATPRRGVRGRESFIASAARTPMFSADPAASTAARSRLGSVRDASPSSAGESVRTAVREEESRVIWSRDERHTVIASGSLPPEVARLVGDADFILHSVSARLDPASGFALVSGQSHAMAWNYAKRTHSSPTVYAFPAPQPTRSPLATVPPALAAFYGSAEPGLILISATGELCFWENMGIALSNVQRYQSLQLSLGDDFAERLWTVDPSTFILTTTASTAFCIRIVPVGGRLVPTATPFTRHGGIFNRSSPAIFPDSYERHGIVAAAPTSGGAYLLGRRMLQKWSINPDGSVRLLHEFSLRESIGTSIFSEDQWHSGNAYLELNDLVAVGPDQLAALVSYAHESHGSDRGHNSHAIVLFENNVHTITISNIVYLSYKAHHDPRMLDVPRLSIPPNSQTAFVRFGDAVVMASLSNCKCGRYRLTPVPYEDAITLKDSARNAFIGTGSGPVPGHPPASLVAMCAVGGIMTLEVNEGVTQGRDRGLSNQAAGTARLKSKLEQAVFFGDRNDNPLTFDLPAGFEGDLAEAAEAVSTEVASSSSPYMPTIFEIRPQLSDRLAKLKDLMVFIQQNGVLSLLPQASRRRLSSQAERVKAALDLWDYQNRLMDQLHSRSPQSLLADSINVYMNEIGDSRTDDTVRLFFRKHVLDLERLLATVFSTFQASVGGMGPGADVSDWILEANRIFIIAVRSSASWRESEAGLYDVDRLQPTVELWTASDSIIEELDSLYGATQQLIKDRSRRLGSIVDEAPSSRSRGSDLGHQQKEQFTLKEQMTHLAAALCENMEDKLRTVATTGDANEGLNLAHSWDELKPRIIRPLVDIDRVQEAFALAEHHRDFPTLVYLCQHPLATSGPARIQAYIERFQSQFAFVLYQWYIDQGQLYDLLSQDEAYGAYLTAFFQQYPHPELSWIHDIARGRYGESAASLVAVEGNTAELAQKHLIASIGKLAAVAELKSRHSDAATQLVSNIDDDLDMVSAQNSLRAALVSLSTPTSGYPRDPSAEKYITTQATQLDRPAFRHVLHSAVSELLAGDALDIESLIDVLTLPDAIDATTALERLLPSHLPGGRRQLALLTIWRRVFIHDDWAAIANTAGRSEEAQHALQRSTATYKTLSAMSDLPLNFVLSPSQATAPPLREEVAARFPSLPAGEIAALLADHEGEIATLNALIADGLEAQVRAVHELVLADRTS